MDDLFRHCVDSEDDDRPSFGEVMEFMVTHGPHPLRPFGELTLVCPLCGKEQCHCWEDDA